VCSGNIEIRFLRHIFLILMKINYTIMYWIYRILIRLYLKEEIRG